MTVRITKRLAEDGGKAAFVFSGLSSDTKPTYDYLSTGSRFWEADTAKQYIYDEVGKTWKEMPTDGNGMYF